MQARPVGMASCGSDTDGHRAVAMSPRVLAGPWRRPGDPDLFQEFSATLGTRGSRQDVWARDACLSGGPAGPPQRAASLAQVVRVQIRDVLPPQSEEGVCVWRNPCQF